MDKRITYQKLRKEGEDKYALAGVYYSILSVLNNLKLTEREVQLVAFTAIRGNMSYANIKEDFCKRYKTSSPTINNMISRMKKLGVFVKENGKVKVNPVLVLDFDREIVLQVTLSHKKPDV